MEFSLKLRINPGSPGISLVATRFSVPKSPAHEIVLEVDSESSVLRSVEAGEQQIKFPYTT
jgi:hypothetical protein